MSEKDKKEFEFRMPGSSKESFDIRQNYLNSDMGDTEDLTEEQARALIDSKVLESVYSNDYDTDYSVEGQKREIKEAKEKRNKTFYIDSLIEEHDIKITDDEGNVIAGKDAILDDNDDNEVDYDSEDEEDLDGLGSEELDTQLEKIIDPKSAKKPKTPKTPVVDEEYENKKKEFEAKYEAFKKEQELIFKKEQELKEKEQTLQKIHNDFSTKREIEDAEKEFQVKVQSKQALIEKLSEEAEQARLDGDVKEAAKLTRQMNNEQASLYAFGIEERKKLTEEAREVARKEFEAIEVQRKNQDFERTKTDFLAKNAERFKQKEGEVGEYFVYAYKQIAEKTKKTGEFLTHAQHLESALLKAEAVHGIKQQEQNGGSSNVDEAARQEALRKKELQKKAAATSARSNVAQKQNNDLKTTKELVERRIKNTWGSIDFNKLTNK